MEKKYSDFRNLKAYIKAFEQGCMIFDLSQNFPKEEKYSLTDQVRRSSRSVCANLAEAYRKRDYKKHFLLKLTDCMGENSETQVWLDFAFQHRYMTEIQYNFHSLLNEEISSLLKYMYNNPDKFGVKSVD